MSENFENLLSKMHIEVICTALNIMESDIVRIYVNPGRSANNENYVVDTTKGSYLYRVPGEGSELFSDRAMEALAYQTLAPFGITDEVVYFDTENGYKLSVYYENSHIPYHDDETELKESMKLLKHLHSLDVSLPFHDDLFNRTEKYRALACKVGGEQYFLPEYYYYLDKVRKFNQRNERKNSKICFTHGDASINNLLFKEGCSKPILIDMEFAAMGDPFSDIATFCVDAEYRAKDILKVLDWYLDRESTNEEKYHVLFLCATAAMMWYGWAAYKLAIEKVKSPYFAFRDDYQAYISEVFSESEMYAEP